VSNQNQHPDEYSRSQEVIEIDEVDGPNEIDKPNRNNFGLD